LKKLLLLPALLLFIFSNAQTDSIAAADSCFNPTRIAGYVDYPDSVLTFSEYGTASWYGKDWNGRMTSSGQQFCPDSLTAAHKHLPFGTVVKVTNMSNDSVVYVKITDRLPKKSTRSIDLTPYVAKELDFYSKGLTKVKIEVVGYAPIYKKTKAPVKK
jgi:rare lipoprotein A (peptidoglycan hydrolase)